MFNAIHVTHEAVHKAGGIGTVLEGLINSRPYRDGVGRTVLLAPLSDAQRPERLGPGGALEYSTPDQVRRGPYADALARVERDFGVRIVYGRRPVEDRPTARRTICEVLLFDVRDVHVERVNALKGVLWERFGIHSDRYEHQWDYEQWVRLAVPAVAALESLRVGTDDAPAIAFAHETMGVPLALALRAYVPTRYRVLYYAHETPSVRRLVEGHAGHDLMMHRALEAARASGLYLEDVFGTQADYYKHALAAAASQCDGILAVGPQVVQELRALGPAFDDVDIELAYNGVPARSISVEEHAASRARVREYCRALLGWEPTFVFTNVTRLSTSKALWRDLDVLRALDPLLGARGQTAALIVLAAEHGPRMPDEILRMEAISDWPLAHREGGSDLTREEAIYYQNVQAFNLRARHTRVVFLNQFGFDRFRAGRRVPGDMDWLDLRVGTDAEFSLSCYEPFGLAGLEPLTYGALCLLSTSCGCASLARQVSARRRTANVLFADYVGGMPAPGTLREALDTDGATRRMIENGIALELAPRLLEALPASPEAAAQLLAAGAELAGQMSWDAVAERTIFPALRRASARRRTLAVAG